MIPRRVRPAAYARHRGISRQSVHYALKCGRIHAETDGLVDIRRADREWAANTSPTNGGERGRKGMRGGRRVQTSAAVKLHGLTNGAETRTAAANPRGKRPKPVPAPSAAASIEVPKPAVEPPEPSSPAAGEGLIAAKTFRENWTGRQAELDYRERARELLDRAEVVKALGDGSRAVQERLFGMIPRLSQLLAPELAPHDVAVTLREEITRALGGLTETLAQLARESAA